MTKPHDLLSIKPLDTELPEPGVARLGSTLTSLQASNPEPLHEFAAMWESDEKSRSILLAQAEICPDLFPFLAAVFANSSYLHDLAKQFPEVLISCIHDGFLQTANIALDLLNREFETEVELMKDLRLAKRKVALVCGLADLGGWWSAVTVSEQITRTADVTLQTAVNFLLKEINARGKIRLPDPNDPAKGSGYTVIAMGKHGAGELNYSSDIDLIVFIEPSAPAIVDPDDSVTLFVRMTKALVRIMQERTADGYVFRTDLRLRPDPGSMPLAIPVSIAMNYYESRGQNWERAALIKARCVAGDQKLGNDILRELVPFIWRRYLDYAAISDVHSIKRQIQDHRGLGELSVPGHNVKLGRGGVREIEFFVQTQQLIAGGRMPELREKRTLEMLTRLRHAGWITELAEVELSKSYLLLRDVEHRLQMVNDAQTHTIPEDQEGLLRIAQLCGVSSTTEFIDLVQAHLERVEGHYANLFSEAPKLSGTGGNLSFTGDDDDPGTVETLYQLGFIDPSKIISIVRGWHYGRYPAMQSAQARERLTELTPRLLQAMGDHSRGDEIALAFDEFLKGLPVGFQLFTLLYENPQLLQLLLRILGSAPRLARIITRRPHIFDGVLEPGFFEGEPSREQMGEALNRTLGLASSYEDGLDRARELADEQRFLIGIRVIGGSLSPDQAGRAYTDLAEVMLAGMIEWVRVPFEQAHGTIQNSHFAVLALGNFASFELTAGSDLDLMLLYSFEPDIDESTGPKPLHASQYFGRFAQRLITAMGAPTAQGIIYEMDFRLRPNGNAGPIATSLSAFQKHYDSHAWTWELFALSRGRVVVGDDAFSNQINEAIVHILAQPRQHSQLAKDMHEMRSLMDKERSASGIWDIKLAEGGLIDLEFIAQFEVLKDVSLRGKPIGHVLHGKEADRLQNDNMTLAAVHSTYLGVVQLLRICLDANTTFSDGPEGFRELVLTYLNLPDRQTAEAYLSDTQSVVRNEFLSVFDPKN